MGSPFSFLCFCTTELSWIHGLLEETRYCAINVHEVCVLFHQNPLYHSTLTVFERTSRAPWPRGKGYTYDPPGNPALLSQKAKTKVKHQGGDRAN
jgi:hypothetical protein